MVGYDTDHSIWKNAVPPIQVSISTIILILITIIIYTQSLSNIYIIRYISMYVPSKRVYSSLKLHKSHISILSYFPNLFGSMVTYFLRYKIKSSPIKYAFRSNTTNNLQISIKKERKVELKITRSSTRNHNSILI